MKNANQIRQLITEIKRHGCCGYAVDRFNRILALLPCETCNGTEIKPPEEGCGYCLAVDGSCWADCPCPDCQKKPSNINPAETIAEYPESQPETPIDK